MDEALQKLIEWIETASPHLWQIMLKQVRIEAFEALIIVLIFVAMAFVSVFLIKKGNGMRKDLDASAWEIVLAVGWAGLPMSIVFGISYLWDFAAYLMNPEFYAIRIILQILGGE